MNRFEGKVALVVGGGSGIGAAAAVRLASEGAAVAVFDIDLPNAEATVSRLRAAGGVGIAVHGDLTDESTVVEAVEKTCELYGGLDFLVNSAFLVPLEDFTVVDTPQEVWDRTIDVNLMGFIRVCRHAIPRILERGGGAIVNMTTGSDRLSEPRRVAYGVSKVGIQALTRHIAVTYGEQGVRANAVAPGLTITPAAEKGTPPEYIEAYEKKNPMRRVFRPEEVAGVIAYLLSEDASNLSGETIHCDGGMAINAG